MHIAYVEDEPDIRDLTCMALGDLGGFRVVPYANAGEALTGIPAGPPPDLLLLDVMLPEMDGRALLGALRALPGLGRVPVIFMTAKTMPSEIAELEDLGAAGVISKPFDPLALPDDIRRHLSGRSPG